MSAVDSSLNTSLRPVFSQHDSPTESASAQSLIRALSLQKHPEGGYFVETDRDSRRVDNPFASSDSKHPHTPPSSAELQDITRSASTTIFYFLTPKSPQGGFHRNNGRTVHTLHKGRGRYIIIHADEVKEKGHKARIETFVVGHDIQKGERLQWIVEGGKFKASFLLPDNEDGGTAEGLLISETVVPGFEFEDHDFMKPEMLRELVTPEQEEELRWLLSPLANDSAT